MESFSKKRLYAYAWSGDSTPTFCLIPEIMEMFPMPSLSETVASDANLHPTPPPAPRVAEDAEEGQ